MAAPEVSQTMDVWQRRWEAVEALIQRAIDSLGCRDASDGAFNEIKKTLEKLKTFGRQQYYFFYNGLVQSNSVYCLASTASLIDHPRFAHYAGHYSLANAILSRILAQVSNDLSILRIAHDQRIAARDFDNTQVNVIEQADQLAKGAFMMIDDENKLDQATRIVTYLRSSTNVRLIPYAPVPLIGIPPTIFTAWRDLLAIPHEVGHYVYWNGRLSEQRSVPSQQAIQDDLNDLFKAVTAPHLLAVRDWAEEICADVVGCIIGGPVVGLSFAELAKQAVGVKFMRNDGAHPIPAIRPLLYAKILCLLNESRMTTAAEQLEHQWQQYLEHERQFDLCQGDLQQQLDLAVGMAAIFVKWVNVDKDVDAIRWSHGEGPIENWFADFEAWMTAAGADSLPAKIEAHLQSRQNLPMPDAKLLAMADADQKGQDGAAPANGDSGPIAMWRDVIKRSTIIGTLENNWIDTLSGKGNLAEEFTAIVDRFEILAEEWLAIFELGGWTTEGPENQPDE
jgi:hypothetical protein